jgi:hypothetical protein
MEEEGRHGETIVLDMRWGASSEAWGLGSRWCAHMWLFGLGGGGVAWYCSYAFKCMVSELTISTFNIHGSNHQLSQVRYLHYTNGMVHRVPRLWWRQVVSAQHTSFNYNWDEVICCTAIRYLPYIHSQAMDIQYIVHVSCCVWVCPWCWQLAELPQPTYFMQEFMEAELWTQ